VGSTRVFVEGKPAARLLSVMAQNVPSNSNAPPGFQVAPSQVRVTVAP
jgi:hypothetical protein